MRRAFAHVINHGLAGLLRAVPWRYVEGAFRMIPWRIVVPVALALCVVGPFVLGRMQMLRGSLAEAEAMSIVLRGRRIGGCWRGSFGRWSGFGFAGQAVVRVVGLSLPDTPPAVFRMQFAGTGSVDRDGAASITKTAT